MRDACGSRRALGCRCSGRGRSCLRATRLQRALLRPRRVHDAVGVAGARGEPRAPHAVLRRGAPDHRSLRRDGREVHRGRRGGRLGSAHRARGRRRARSPGRARARDAIGDIGADQGLYGLSGRVGIVPGRWPSRWGRSIRDWSLAGGHTASRVQSVAVPGQVWVDDITRLLSSAAISYTDAGVPTSGQGRPGALWRRAPWSPPGWGPACRRARGPAHRAGALAAPRLGTLPRLGGVSPPCAPPRRRRGRGRQDSSGVGVRDFLCRLTSTVMCFFALRLADGEGVAFWAVGVAVWGRLSADSDVSVVVTVVLLAASLSFHGVSGEGRGWMQPRLVALLWLSRATSLRWLSSRPGRLSSHGSVTGLSLSSSFLLRLLAFFGRWSSSFFFLVVFFRALTHIIGCFSFRGPWPCISLWAMSRSLLRRVVAPRRSRLRPARLSLLTSFSFFLS